MDISISERAALMCIRSCCMVASVSGQIVPFLQGKKGLGKGQKKKKIRHIAFIMDGNRRWARKREVPVTAGHRVGFEKLKQTLQWCLEFGVEVVTVYAFSIENFRRGPDEIQGLMTLAAEKLEELVDEREGIIQKFGVRVDIIGELHLLPERVQRSAAYAMKMSQHHNRAVLNICLSYTARQDITNAIRMCAEGVQEGLIETSDVNEDVISACLGTGRCPPPDIVFRTSGEIRLSDFMLWESAHSCLWFERAMWPDLSLISLALCFIRYHYLTAVAVSKNSFEGNDNCLIKSNSAQSEKRISAFIQKAHDKRWQKINAILESSPYNKKESVKASNRKKPKFFLYSVYSGAIFFLLLAITIASTMTKTQNESWAYVGVLIFLACAATLFS